MSSKETLHPGVYVIEEPGIPRIVGVGVSTGSLVGVMKKGPIDKPGLVTSWSQFVNMYGGYFGDNPIPFSVFAFFDNGGTRMYISRAAGSGNAAATKNLKGQGNSVDTLKVDAFSPGAWGNEIAVQTSRWAVKTGEALEADDTSLILVSVEGVQKGDRVVITDGTTIVSLTVLGVDFATKEISFKTVGTITTIASGSDAMCSTSHRASTTITEDLETGATSTKLASATGVRIGSVMFIGSATEGTYIIVTGVNGKTISFSAVTLAATIVSGSIAVSQEFNIKVLENGVAVETLNFLSMSDTNKKDFVEQRVSGDGNESNYLILTDLDSSGSLEDHIPWPTDGTLLADGAEGATVTDTDVIGVNVQGTETGIYLFNRVDEINMISIPGFTSIVVAGKLIDYCEARHAAANPIVAILETPESDSTPLEAQEYRSIELGRDSSHAALYYPWLKIPDPVNAGVVLNVPPSGFVQGVWARTASERGLHKAPANEAIRGIIGVAYPVTDSEQDILNPISVNVIRSFIGRGIRIWGARTLTSVHDGRHYVNVRRLLNFIEESIVESSAFAPFEPNDSDLWDTLRLSNSSFLNTLWKDGMLIPRDDRSRAFFVKVDSENNPQSEIDAGRVNIEIGVNPSKPAEFVIFKIGLWDGGRLLEEII